MAIRHPMAWAAATVLALSATGARAAEDSCMTRAQMADLVIVATPAIFSAIRQQCVGAMAPDSPLLDPAGPLTARYEAAAKDAWPRARAALAVSGGRASPEARKRVFEAMTPQFVASLLIPMMTKLVPPKACPDANHLVTLLTPLSPASFGDLVATLIDLDDTRKMDDRSSLRICGN